MRLGPLFEKREKREEKKGRGGGRAARVPLLLRKKKKKREGKEGTVKDGHRPQSWTLSTDIPQTLSYLSSLGKRKKKKEGLREGQKECRRSLLQCSAHFSASLYGGKKKRGGGKKRKKGGGGGGGTPPQRLTVCYDCYQPSSQPSVVPDEKKTRSTSDRRHIEK